jgi:hypothetical protein
LRSVPAGAGCHRVWHSDGPPPQGRCQQQAGWSIIKGGGKMRIAVKQIWVLFMLLSFNLPYYPCLCEKVTIQDAIIRSDKIFSGRVIEISDYKKDETNIRNMVWQVRFLVIQGWKGVNSKEIVVLTAKSGPSCGYNFQLDKEYLVYSVHDGVDLCLPTKLLEKAAPDLAILGPPQYLPK